MDNYQIVKQIRANKIFLVKDQNKQQFYQKLYSLDSKRSDHLWIVLNTLKNVNYPNIVKICKVFKDDQYIYEIEEVCEFQSLRIQVQNNKYDNSNIIKCMLDIIEGLIQLKSLNLMHRDIKPDNIVFDGQNYKLIDFETAQFIHDDKIKVYSLDIGTNGYRAPQIIFDRKYSSKCDIWSLGCVLYFMLLKKEMFFEQNIQNESYFQEIMQNISQNNLIQPYFIDLLQKMLQIDESKRIGLKQLKENFQNLKKQTYNVSIDSTQIGITTQDIRQNDSDVENFGSVMIDLIYQERNAQNQINLYRFWSLRLEKKFPNDFNLRQKIKNVELIQLKEFQNKGIPINEFISKEEIKASLKQIEILQKYFDF